MVVPFPSPMRRSRKSFPFGRLDDRAVLKSFDREKSRTHVSYSPAPFAKLRYVSRSSAQQIENLAQEANVFIGIVLRVPAEIAVGTRVSLYRAQIRMPAEISGSGDGSSEG